MEFAQTDVLNIKITDLMFEFFSRCRDPTSKAFALFLKTATDFLFANKHHVFEEHRKAVEKHLKEQDR